MSQHFRMPDLAAQRAAMQKLNFLIGRWTGEARLLHAPGEYVELAQTEEVQYKLGGLILVIEGVGRARPGNQPLLQAFGIISYDDESGDYSLRAFNDGRVLESALKLLDEGLGMTWGFTLGEIRTSSVLRINSRGEWTELAELTIGSNPPKKLLELTVRPQK